MVEEKKGVFLKGCNTTKTRYHVVEERNIDNNFGVGNNPKKYI